MAGLLDNAINNPLVNIGAGLLANSGPSLMPQGIGPGLAQGIQLAQQGQSRALQNDIRREALTEASRRRAGREHLKGLLAGQNPMLGALADVAPGAVAQGLVSQAFPRANSTLQLLQAAGIDPNSEQGRQLITSSLGGGSEAIMAQLKILELTQNIEGATKEKQDESIQKELNANRTTGNLLKLGRLTKRLADPSLSLDSANDLLLFNSVANDLSASAALDQFGGQGGVSNAKLAAVASAKPQVLQPTGTRSEIIANWIDLAVEGAKKKGIKIENLPELEQMSKDLRKLSGNPTGKRGKASNEVDFSALPSLGGE